MDEALARGAPLTLKALAVSGAELESLVGRGPEVGRLLAELLDVVLLDPSRNERTHLLEEARARVRPLD